MMSTSDAAGSELRAETAQHGTARLRSAAARELQDEHFQAYDRNPSGRQSYPSATGQEEAHTALIVSDDSVRREGETAQCDSKIQRPDRTKFTSSLFLRLCSSPDLGVNQNPDLIANKKPDLSLHSLTATAEADNRRCKIDGQTSGPDLSVKVFTDPTSSDKRRFTDRKTGESLTVTSLETIKDRTLNQTSLSRESGSHEHGGLHSAPSIRDQTKSEKQTDSLELSDPSRTMLSSSMVMVLAPQWSGKLRRSKKSEGTSNPEAQGTLQDVTNSSSHRGHERFQETADRSSIHRSHEPMRAPFAGIRRNTEGWSTKSGPASLDYEYKRKMTHTVSLDVNSRRLDNRNMNALSPVARASPPTSPLSLDQRRNPQTLNQGGMSSLSSKPITSSLLLSLRRFNSSGRICTAEERGSEINPAPALPTRLSPTHRNNNGQDKPNSPLSPPFISSKTSDTAPLLSPPSTNQRGKTVFETRLFSAPPSDKDKEDIRQPQIITRAQSSLLCSNQAALNRGLAERRQNFRGSHSNLFSESSGSSPSHTNDRSAFLLPRRTTLTSTSWWKQVTQEGSSPPKLDDTTSMKDKPNTPFAPPSNNNNKNELDADIKRFNSQITNNRDSNSTTESVCKGSVNLVMKPQGGSQNLKERISGDPPEHDSDKLVKRLNESRFNNREPQKPQSLPAVYYRSKISIATEQTLSHPEDLRERDGRDKSCTPNTTGLRPTLPNPRTLNAPPEINSQHNSNQCAFKANSSPTSPHSKDSHSLSQPLLKKDPSFSSHPIPSQNNYQTQSHSDSSSQTSHFKVGFTPLGFERRYDSVAKSLQSKTASSLLFSKTHTTPVFASSPPTAKHPAAKDAPRTPLLPPPVIPALTSSSSTPNITSSLLTPPVTPIITSPDSGSSSPGEGRSLSSSQERDSKKHRSEGKRVRRVTWEDSVDLQNSEPITVKTQEPSQVPTSLLSSPRSSSSVRTPSIFSLLRASRQTTETSPACSTTTRTSSIQAGKGRKYPSFSSDAVESASKEQDGSKPDPLVLDQKTQEVPTTRQERTLSVESGMVESRSSTALSLPPDFSSGYKLRYSSPPYSTLMSSRSTQGETKPSTPRAQLFQNSLTYVPHLSKKADPGSAMTSPPYKAHATSISPLQSHALPLQSKTSSQESSNFVVSKNDQVSKNNSKNKSQDCQSSQTLLVNNRANIGSHSLQGTKVQSSSPTCVIETLVYSIKPKGETVASKNSTTKELQRGANTAMSVENRLQSKGTAGEPGSHLEPSSGGGSSTDSHSTDDGSRKMKDSVVCKSRVSSVEGSNEQSSKKSRFALKKTTPNSNLSRSESDKANKTNNKMDQVFSKLRQTFSTRRTDDDVSFPWKWRRGSQTPSVGGSSDTSNVSDIPTETKISEKSEQKKEEVLRDNVKDTEDNSRWTQDRYSLISTPASGGAVAGEKNCSDKSSPENDLGRKSTEHMSGNKVKPHLTIQSPTTNPYNLYDDNRTDYQSSNQLLSSQDLSPGRSSNLSAGYSQFRRSTPSPRSPFSPFSSLSPLSPFPSSDATVADDVFYSPKLQRRRESPSPCEEKPGEGISLRGSRKSRASTGPPSPGPGQDQICSASSYADLKYGIEPGRSFSVSSVLSSRPSGPGRISTGSRFMSVGDLTESALTCEGTSKDQWSVSPDWTTEFDSLPSKDRLMAYFPSDPDKIKTRSLPRSLTRRLANWSSVPPSEPSTSKPARLWSPNMNTSHFSWDTEGPPTPPPTPPLSPVSRRMSKPPSQSSPTCPISPGQQQVDSPSSRGHLPSRTYVSSLSTFEESSDSDSDTTTDDEYYLETGEEEKETEL